MPDMPIATRRADPSSQHHLVDRVPAVLRRGLRRVLHVWFRMSRGMTLGVRAVVLSETEEVLLVRHTYTPGWHLPGGGVEPGETLLMALAKELREEACIRLGGEAQLHGVFYNEKASPRDHVAVFVVRDYVQEGPHVPNREIAEARFFPLNALPAQTTAGTRRRLAEILDEEPVSPLWS
jgi:ADP-ribose pyrophosphatase YjhB (NUDIX family)